MKTFPTVAIVVAFLLGTLFGPRSATSAFWLEGEEKAMIIVIRNTGRQPVSIADGSGQVSQNLLSKDLHVIQLLGWKKGKPLVIEVKAKSGIDPIPTMPTVQSPPSIIRTAL